MYNRFFGWFILLYKSTINVTVTVKKDKSKSKK